MILIDGLKYACERCIRGHRATKCSHSDQPLVVIKNKGRPSTVCDYCKSMRHDKNSHPEGACSCGTEEKLRKKREQLREERKLKKLQKKAIKQVDSMSQSSDNSSVATNGLHHETVHALNCKCYDSGVCNCHKTRKSASNKISKKKHVSKRRGSESSTDIGSRILASQASDHISFNSFLDSASLYSHDSFSNARLMNGSHMSLNNHNISGSKSFQHINGTHLEGNVSSHTSPDEKLLFLNSSNADSIKSTSKVPSHSYDSPFNGSPATNLDNLTPLNSFSNNPRRVSSNTSIQYLNNDIHSLNEHRKTHWQLHNNHSSNSFRRVESMKSLSTNNEHVRHTPDYSTNQATLFKPNTKRDSHGLLDHISPPKNDTNTDLENFLDSFSNIPPNEPLNKPERGLFDSSGPASFKTPSFSKHGNSEIYNVNNFLQSEEPKEAKSKNTAPMAATDSAYFDEFLAQNQDDLKIDENLLQTSLGVMPSTKDIEKLMATTEPMINNDPLPESFFETIDKTPGFDHFNGNISNGEAIVSENKQPLEGQNDEDEEKNAMVLSLRLGTLGLSHLLGSLDKEDQ